MAPTRMALVACAVPVAILLALLLTGVHAALPVAVVTLVATAGAAATLEFCARDIAAATREHDARYQVRLAAALAGLHARVEAEQALMQRLPDPLVIVDANRTILRANAAATATFGPGLASVLRHPGMRAAMDRALAENRAQSAEISLPVPVARDVSASVIPVDPPLENGGRIAAVLADRTRERAVERMRADFVANASHELRTPLASLIGFIDTLRGPAADDPPAQARFLAIMSEQAQRMNRLIDDLLSLSRIELTEHQRPSDIVDVSGLVRRLADAFEPRIAARAMTLLQDIPADLPVVQGDEDQLEQVLQNLLDNAVKYGRQGGTVTLRAIVPAPGQPWPHRPGLLIAVGDDGAGIARRHIPRLTERFYRADKHRSRAVGGTGLGLAIVKHIVNRHRGRLLIESEEGVGTTVTAWLPALPAAESAATGGA